MPLRKTRFPGQTVNERLKFFGRAGYVMARCVVPHIRNPRTLQHMIETTRRDIYAETVDAMGYDPLARR